MADNPGILADYIVWMDVDVLNLIWISDSWVASPKKRGGENKCNKKVWPFVRKNELFI